MTLSAMLQFMENGDLGQAMQRDRKGVLSWYKR